MRGNCPRLTPAPMYKCEEDLRWTTCSKKLSMCPSLTQHFSCCTSTQLLVVLACVWPEAYFATTLYLFFEQLLQWGAPQTRATATLKQDLGVYLLYERIGTLKGWAIPSLQNEGDSPSRSQDCNVCTNHHLSVREEHRNCRISPLPLCLIIQVESLPTHWQNSLIVVKKKCN